MGERFPSGTRRTWPRLAGSQYRSGRRRCWGRDRRRCGADRLFAGDAAPQQRRARDRLQRSNTRFHHVVLHVLIAASPDAHDHLYTVLRSQNTPELAFNLSSRLFLLSSSARTLGSTRLNTSRSQADSREELAAAERDTNRQAVEITGFFARPLLRVGVLDAAGAIGAQKCLPRALEAFEDVHLCQIQRGLGQPDGARDGRQALGGFERDLDRASMLSCLACHEVIPL